MIKGVPFGVVQNGVEVYSIFVNGQTIIDDGSLQTIFLINFQINKFINFSLKSINKMHLSLDIFGLSTCVGFLDQKLFSFSA